MYQESVVQNHLVENKNTKMYPEKKERKKKDALKKKKLKIKNIFFFSLLERDIWLARKANRDGIQEKRETMRLDQAKSITYPF